MGGNMVIGKLKKGYELVKYARNLHLHLKRFTTRQQYLYYFLHISERMLLQRAVIQVHESYKV